MRLVALVLLCLVATASVLVAVRPQTGYAVQDRDHVAAEGSAIHWAGTDQLGRDRAARVAVAVLLGLTGAAAASALASIIAVSVGVTAAFAPRGVAACLMYLCDLFLALPWLFLLMIVRSALPLNLAPAQSAAVTFLLLALLGWPAYARMTYAGAFAIRNSEWLIQGLAAGLRKRQLVLQHILPQLRPLLLSQFLICIPACLIAEANLGTMGLGISEPLPSWGAMLLEVESSAVLASSHWVYLPVFLLMTVLLLLELLVFEV